MLSYTRTALQMPVILVFCLHKNTRLQNETNISITFGVNNVGFLQRLLFGLVPVYVSVKILYFHQVLERKNTKTKKIMRKVLKLCKF